MGPIQTIDEFLGLLWRRRLLIAAITVACTVAVVLMVLARPKVYQATAVIQVESPTITDASGAVMPSSSAQRMQTIQQRLTTRDALLDLVERHGLFAGLPLTNDDKVLALRMAISFEPVATAGQSGYGGAQQVSALIINARSDDPDKAARIANDLAQGVLDASFENQTTRTREASSFFSEEEERLESQIEALQSDIATYRNTHADSLPELGESRRSEVTAIDSEIRQLDQTLVELANERTRIGQGRTLRESDQQQVDAIVAQENVLRAQRGELSTRRDVVTAALAMTPEVERTLGTMERRLEQLQAEFEGVTRRKAEAETAQKLQERQQGERFTLLERAVTPVMPITGGRKKLVMAGTVASLMAGIVLAFLMDVLFPALRTRTQFERDVGILPVVAIPEMHNLRRPRRAPSIPARPGAAAATAGGVFDSLLAAPPLRFLSTVPRPAIGAGAAVLLILLVAAVA